MTTHEDPRLREAFALLDAMHREDPSVGTDGPKSILASLDYHQRLGRWVERLAPEASSALRLAAHSQHVRRWAIPRDSYPMTRKGYRDWRDALGRFHARAAAEVLVRVGYESQTVARVEQLLRKQRLRTDPEAQALEDAACLVFLEVQLEDFSRQHTEEKLLHILRRTWKKMSPDARTLALRLELSEGAAGLVRKAVRGSGNTPGR
ncbi:MAG: DUF4202 domain-containing protein [Acidobacteriota bacterium]|nr:DUF4202 domain-containing protein [Acidobacteriota bacterium]